MAKKYFVTRHRGAITWAADGGTKARKVEMDNFDPGIVMPGDIVMGTLPVHLAAAVNQRGGHYWHLSMDIPPEHRGKEISAEQMTEYGACLKEFRLIGLGTRVSSTRDITPQPERTGADVHICIASGEALANYIPMRTLTWKKVRIYFSKKMEKQAMHLKELAGAVAQMRGLSDQGICEIVAMPSKDDWHSLTHFAASEAATLNATETSVDINLTGGTKAMTMAFAEAFQSVARRLYCATDSGELQFWDTLNTPPQVLAPDLVDLNSYLAAQAWKIERRVVSGDANSKSFAERQHLTASIVFSFQSLDKARETVQIKVGVEDRKLEKLKILPMTAIRLMHHVAAECAPVKRKKPFEPRVNMTGISAGLNALLCAFEKAGLIRDFSVNKSSKTDSDNASTVRFSWASEAACTYASGGYLEEYVWAAVKALNLPKEHYGANVAVSSRDLAKKKPNGVEFNEMDVAIVWGNKLVAIECKAGRQLTSGKDQDIINKLDSIKDNMGGAKGKALLVIPQKIGEELILERAMRNGVTLIHGPKSMENLCDIVAEHLHLPKPATPWPVKADVARFG